MYMRSYVSYNTVHALATTVIEHNCEWGKALLKSMIGNLKNIIGSGLMECT